MRIGIIGAGAIGGWIGIRLAQSGHAVSVLARGDRLEALRRGPWRLQQGDERLTATVQASDDPAALGAQDLLVITLKGPALPQVAPRLAPMLAPNSLIVPAMNGVPWWFVLEGAGACPPLPLRSVDPDGGIARALPLGQVLGCVVHASVSAPDTDLIQHIAGNRLILGEPDGPVSDRLGRVAELFSAAGFAVETTADVKHAIWYKLWGNMTMNPISALTGATADRILDDPLVSDFVLRVMAEAQSIGARIGLPINERGEDRNLVTRRLGAFKTSMLQDAIAGRPLELDQLVAAPLEIAAALGMETPNMAALFGLSRLFARCHGLYPDASQ